MRIGQIGIFLICLTLIASTGPGQLASAKEPAGLELLIQLENVFVEISDRVKPAVVNISPSRHPTLGKKGEHPSRGRPDTPGTGSGVIISKEGYIVTNSHVVGGAKEVQVRLSDKRKFIGRVIGKDPDTDLAVVKVDPEGDLPVVDWGESSKAKVGQWVIAVGNPFGLDRTVTVGVISGIGRENVQLSRYEDFIQTDASINPGNSGGPLFNIHGKVIGINTAIINFAQGIGFAIPSDMAQDIVKQLIERGQVVRGWLGVGIQAVTEDLAGKFGVKASEGVLINEVFEGDPADKSGLLPGDIITKINGKVVDTPQTLSRIIAGMGPDKKIKVVVMRDGKGKTITVTLAQRKDEAIVASIPPEPKSLLGITVEDLTDELAERYKLKEEKGALVTKVDPGSIGEAQGLKEGDLIREVNRKEIKGKDDFSKVSSDVEKGESLLIRVIRENRAFYVVLKTEEEKE